MSADTTAELLALAAREAAKRERARGERWRLRKATVSYVNTLGTHVIFDGDGTADVVRVISTVGRVAAGARVVVVFVPPKGNYIVGWDEVHPVGRWLTAVKDESLARSSTSTLTDDPDLSLPLLANARYQWQAQVIYTSGTTPDFKLDLSLPTDADHRSVAITWARATAAPTQGADQRMFYTGETVATPGDGTTFGTQSRIMDMRGTIETIQAGRLVARWAQNVSTASDTTVYAGSSIALLRTL